MWPSTLYSAHINYLELLTVWKALKNVLPYLQGLHVLVCCDNTTAIWTARGDALLQASCTAHRLLVWSRPHFLSFRGDSCPGHSEQGCSPFVVGEPTLWRMAPPPSDSGTAMKEVWSGTRWSLRLMQNRPLFYVLLATGWGPPPPPFSVDALAHPWPSVLLYFFSSALPNNSYPGQGERTEFNSDFDSTQVAQNSMAGRDNPLSVCLAMAPPITHGPPILSERGNPPPSPGLGGSLGLAHERANINTLGLPPRVIATIQKAGASSVCSLLWLQMACVASGARGTS